VVSASWPAEQRVVDDADHRGQSLKLEVAKLAVLET
jgi:hypothetical protein